MKKRILFLVSLFLIVSLGAMAAEPIVNEVRIVNLRHLSGLALNVFYVSGRQATLGVEGRSLSVRQIQAAPIRVSIDSSGQVVIPARALPRLGFSVFNNMVLVVTKVDAPAIYMQNPDGSVPLDARMAPAGISNLPSHSAFSI
ncbi:hypothetical protein WDW86_02360 [Bdellovibrionota bacterium FG-2]